MRGKPATPCTSACLPAWLSRLESPSPVLRLGPGLTMTIRPACRPACLPSTWDVLPACLRRGMCFAVPFAAAARLAHTSTPHPHPHSPALSHPRSPPRRGPHTQTHVHTHPGIVCELGYFAGHLNAQSFHAHRASRLLMRRPSCRPCERCCTSGGAGRIWLCSTR